MPESMSSSELWILKKLETQGFQEKSTMKQNLIYPHDCLVKRTFVNIIVEKTFGDKRLRDGTLKIERSCVHSGGQIKCLEAETWEDLLL